MSQKKRFTLKHTVQSRIEHLIYLFIYLFVYVSIYFAITIIFFKPGAQLIYLFIYLFIYVFIYFVITIDDITENHENVCRIWELFQISTIYLLNMFTNNVYHHPPNIYWNKRCPTLREYTIALIVGKNVLKDCGYNSLNSNGYNTRIPPPLVDSRVNYVH